MWEALWEVVQIKRHFILHPGSERVLCFYFVYLEGSRCQQLQERVGSRSERGQSVSCVCLFLHSQQPRDSDSLIWLSRWRADCVVLREIGRIWGEADRSSCRHSPSQYFRTWVYWPRPGKASSLHWLDFSWEATSSGLREKGKHRTSWKGQQVCLAAGPGAPGAGRGPFAFWTSNFHLEKVSYLVLDDLWGPILVHSGSYNKWPETEWLRRQNLFRIAQKAGHPRSRCQRGQFWLGFTCHMQVGAFLLCPHMVEGGLPSSLASSYRGTNPIHESPTHMT